jgi:superfamily II DNA/RNA helicase
MARLILDRTSDSKQRFTLSGEMDWKLRQATGIAKAPYVAAFVKMLLESEEAIVLFGWHRAVYDLWMQELAEFNPVLYTGSESPKQKEESVQAFVGGKSRVMIVSLRSGAGLDGLQKRSSVAVFGELDWSPEMHNQCIGRLARDGQEATVAAYFLVADSGSDPVVSDVLELKRQQAEPIRDPDAKLLAGTVDTTDRMQRLAESVLARAAARQGAA